jgi:hypothetical protein
VPIVIPGPACLVQVGVTQHRLAFPELVQATTEVSAPSAAALGSARRHVLAQPKAPKCLYHLLLVTLAILSQVRMTAMRHSAALLAVSDTAHPRLAGVLRPPAVVGLGVGVA